MRIRIKIFISLCRSLNWNKRFSETNLNLQIRAWNTLSNHAYELAGQIYEILNKLEITEENERILIIFFLFYQEKILNEENIQMFFRMIDEA